MQNGSHFCWVYSGRIKIILAALLVEGNSMKKLAVSASTRQPSGALRRVGFNCRYG
jgi:hypothetical protein